MHINEKSKRLRGLLLKCVATSHVRLLFFTCDLWLRNLTLKEVVVEPTYCKEHLLQDAKYTTFLELQNNRSLM